MVLAKKWVLAQRFEGQPQVSNFKLVTEEVSEGSLKDGEVLLEAIFLSVDPYMRLFPTPIGDPVIGEQIARVQCSKCAELPVGSEVLASVGWRTHTVVTDTATLKKLPKMEGLSKSLALGVVGMPGMTAYFGVMDKLKVKAGDTLVVNSAAGAVGSVVGQIAKLQGCKVIGFAGSNEKCDWLKNELGFDHVFNYKETKIEHCLEEAAPGGIDCYFDNVGGEFTNKAVFHMNTNGRVVICGQIDQYKNDDKPQTGPLPYREILMKQLTIQGIIVFNYLNLWPEAQTQMVEWIKQGKIKYHETVSGGFEQMAEAFVGLFHGAAYGKVVIKV